MFDNHLDGFYQTAQLRLKTIKINFLSVKPLHYIMSTSERENRHQQNSDLVCLVKTWSSNGLSYRRHKPTSFVSNFSLSMLDLQKRWPIVSPSKTQRVLAVLHQAQKYRSPRKIEDPHPFPILDGSQSSVCIFPKQICVGAQIDRQTDQKSSFPEQAGQQRQGCCLTGSRKAIGSLSNGGGRRRQIS